MKSYSFRTTVATIQKCYRRKKKQTNKKKKKEKQQKKKKKKKKKKHVISGVSWFYYSHMIMPVFPPVHRDDDMYIFQEIMEADFRRNHTDIA